jgi:hypothetical protein
MQLTNKSDYQINVVTRDYHKPIPRGGTLEVPDSVGEIWIGRPAVSSLVEDGLILVKGETVETKAPKKRGRKSKLDKVAAETDLDKLEAMLAEEQRDDVKAAITQRLTELT